MKKRFVKLALLSAVLFAAAPAFAQSVDDKIKTLEQELSQLKDQQVELKKEATAAAAALPTFEYRPGNGLEVEAADKSWGVRFTIETHFRYEFESGRTQQGRSTAELMGRRFRPGILYCINNCLWEIEATLDLDGFGTGNGKNSLNTGTSSVLQRGAVNFHAENLNPFLPTVQFGMEVQNAFGTSLSRQGSGSVGAQAEYDLQAVVGAEEIARGDLATAVGTSASVPIKVQPLDQLPTPDSIGETVEQAMNRAFAQRPDLMQQATAIRAANATLKEARAAYYPSLSLNVRPAAPSLYGIQRPFDWSHTADLTGSVSFSLKWTVFDSGARKSRAAQAQADIHAAEAQTNLEKNQIADQVWTAYSNLNTAFRQHKTAIALLAAASQSYNAALESYNYGLRNLLDVTAAQRALSQARSADVFARTQVLTAVADLAFATGDSIQANNGRSHP